jgi:hypothetical protein
MFTAFLGTCRCFRCGADSEAYIQTYLFKTDYSNAMHCYRVGESEIMDGLDEYWLLHPWNGQTPLVIAVGEWGCRQCELDMQWAKVTLSVARSRFVEEDELRPGLEGRFESIETLVPTKPDTLDGVHLVEPDLVRLSGFLDGGGKGGYFDHESAWSACSVEQRCSTLVTGFREWCAQAGIDIDHHEGRG